MKHIYLMTSTNAIKNTRKVNDKMAKQSTSTYPWTGIGVNVQWSGYILLEPNKSKIN